jgi:heterodisulfide reductase subunit C
VKDIDLGIEMLRKTAKENIWTCSKCHKAGEKCVKQSFVMCALCQIMLGW